MVCQQSVFIISEWGRNKDLIDFEKDQIVIWPPNSPYLNLIEHLWDVSDQQVNLLQTSWCQILQNTFRSLVEFRSLLFWQHTVNQQHI